MTCRVPFVAALLLLLLISLPAQAGELKRRITLLNGDVEVGYILERGDSFVVLQRDDGSAVELGLDTIDQIEVLTGGATLPSPTSDAPAPGATAPRDRDLPEGESRRFQTDWADQDSDSQELEVWEDRYLKATLGHALSVAPTIPLMSLGFIELASAPLVVGGFNTGIRVGMGAVGSALLLGSTGSAVLGAMVAREGYGVKRDTLAIKLGLSFGIAGAALYTGTFALAHGILTGEVPGQNDQEGPAIAVLVGLGLGSVIVGNTILMSDARESKNLADDQVESRERRRRRSAASPPQLLAVWGAPTVGGLSGGLSLAW